MRKAKLCVMVLVFVITLTCVPYTSSLNPYPMHAQANSTIQGTINYHVRGPMASPYGVGTSLVGGGVGMPVAIARVQKMIGTALDLVDSGDSLSMGEVSEWAHDGIPFDIGKLLPISGMYNATITFTLEEKKSGVYELKSGHVEWVTANDFDFAMDDITMKDHFRGSGGQALDPAKDTITLTVDNDGFTLEMDISHSEPVTGSSEFNAGGGLATITLTATNGEMVMDGSSLGIPLSAVGMPRMAIVEEPGMERSVSYFCQGNLSEMNDYIEMWRDLFDNTVLVEYYLGN